MSPLRRRLKRVARELLPPFIWEGLRWLRYESRLLGPREWEYVPEGWARAHDGAVKGWNVEAVAETESSRWSEYVSSLTGTGPLGTTANSGPSEEWDFGNHNLWISHAYVVALAAGGRDRVTILDWGGSLGYFKLAAAAALPGVEIGYEVKEVPVLCEYGRRIQPDVVFHEDDSCLERRFDLVLASGSFQFNVEWRSQLERLGRAAAPFLYLTLLPVVFEQPSFVTLQRAYRYGYETEYLGWFLNRGELLDGAAQAGLTLVREFLGRPHPRVSGAPEQGEYRGYLFRADDA
jgi:putative methyltransferase (TIGR04325 family)